MGFGVAKVAPKRRQVPPAAALFKETSRNELNQIVCADTRIFTRLVRVFFLVEWRKGEIKNGTTA